MPKPSSKPPPPSFADPQVGAAVAAVFEKYATFALSPAQVALEVQAPLPELLLALDELVAARKVREVGPSTYQHAKGAAAAPREASTPVPPDEPVQYGDDARGGLFSAWSRAFALRIVRQRGIVASTLDRATRHHLGVRRAGERGLKTGRWFDFEGLIKDADVFTLDQVAQTYVDRRAEEMEHERQWAARNPDKEPRPSEPLTLEVARAHVEKEAIGSVLQEAQKLAVARQPHLCRPALDRIWLLVRDAEASPPAPGLSDAEQQRAWKLWQIGRTVLGWAMRVEAGKSGEPWVTAGGRPVTPDAHKMWPEESAPVDVGAFLDGFIEQFSKQEALESAEAMHRDEEVAEIKPVLARYLKQAKDLDREWSKKFPEEDRAPAITTALYETVEHLAMAHGTPLGDGYRERLLEGFPDIDSTDWVITWTAQIAGTGWDIAKQTAARRLKVAGRTPKPHDPPHTFRDGDKVILAVPPTPLEVLEIELRSRVLEGAADKLRAAATQKTEAAERKKRKAARKPAKGSKRRKFWS